jgi:hypothetical protein
MEGVFMGDAVGGLIVFVGLAALLFLVCRVIVLWYWRVGEAIDLLKGINEKLDRIAERPGTIPQTPVPADADRQFEKWLATRDPPLVNLSPGDRAYYRQSWESSHAHDGGA